MQNCITDEIVYSSPVLLVSQERKGLLPLEPSFYMFLTFTEF